MTDHSAKFEDVKQHYDLRLLKKSTVKLSVKKDGLPQTSIKRLRAKITPDKEDSKDVDC